MARCSSCNKFPALDSSSEPEAELEMAEGTITGTVRIVLTSECCGDEIKECAFDIDHDAEGDIANALVKAAQEASLLGSEANDLAGGIDWDADGVELEVDADGGEITDRYQTTDRRGKPIKARYQKRYWGFSLEATIHVTYPYGGQVLRVDVPVHLEDEAPAGSMEDLSG